MRVKKVGSKVFGANLTTAERKAMELEINRQIVKADKEYINSIDILVLYVLHRHLGFGKQRLRRFYEAFTAEHKKLIAHYELPDEDNVWLADQKLKAIGVDVAAWNAEREGMP